VLCCPLLLAIVFVRQIHVWTIAPLCVAAWLGASPEAVLLPTGSGADSWRSRLLRVLLVLLSALPALLLLAWFFRLWHGPVPPTFQVAAPASDGNPGHPRVSGFNATTPSIILCLAGIYGVFFVGYFTLGRKNWRLLLAGAAGGLVLSVLPHSAYNSSAGRDIGFWRMLRHVPSVADRSPVIWALGTLGGVVLAAAFAGLSRRDRWIFASAWAGFTAAQVCSALAWQRYLDPFILMLTALMAAHTSGEPALPTVRRLAYFGPALLGTGLALGTVLSLR
jgi:hypothetical protein